MLEVLAGANFLRIDKAMNLTNDSRAAALNRREFLVRSASLAALSWLVGNSAYGQSAGAPPVTAAPGGAKAPAFVPEFRPLRRNVGLFTARGGAIGWLAGPDALAVVDTQFPETAELCLAGLPGRANRTIDVVINTHHHGDHTSGNSVFKPVAKTIVAQANVPALQRAVAERTDAARSKDVPLPTKAIDQQVYADTTFAETWRQELGDEVVNARYFGAAHTNGDAVVLFEKANVVHMGDLVFNRLYPVIDRVGGASIRHWIVVLEKIAREYPADGIYIFGHGSKKYDVTGRRADLLVLRDYLVSLLEHVQAQITAGKNKAEISTMENFPGFTDFHQPLPNRLGSNLGVAYDELTQGKS
jgi:glyoxylase-like metal-dependent hydrolase (beta-lactamase superfamily II)